MPDFVLVLVKRRAADVWGGHLLPSAKCCHLTASSVGRLGADCPKSIVDWNPLFVVEVVVVVVVAVAVAVEFVHLREVQARILKCMCMRQTTRSQGW